MSRSKTVRNGKQHIKMMTGEGEGEGGKREGKGRGGEGRGRGGKGAYLVTPERLHEAHSRCWLRFLMH